MKIAASGRLLTFVASGLSFGSAVCCGQSAVGSDSTRDRGVEASRVTRIVCDLTTAELPFFQAEDGRIPANWACAGAPEEAGMADADLHTTALTTLSILGDGATLNGGRFCAPLERAVLWLRRQQDAAGRFGLRTDPSWWVDHAIATFAISEAARTSANRSLRPSIEGGIAFLVDHLRRLDRRVDPVLLLWCRLAASSALRVEQTAGEASLQSPCEVWDSGARSLDAEVTRLVTREVPVGETRRAARYLLLTLDASDQQPELRQAMAPAFATGESSLDDADPEALLFVTIAHFLEGGDAWKRWERRLSTTIVRARSNTDGVRDTWTPRGPYGDRHGRNGTTAARILVLEMYYRYSALVWSDC